MDAFSVPVRPSCYVKSGYLRVQCSLTKTLDLFHQEKVSLVQLCLFPFYNKVFFVFHSEDELPMYDIVEEKVSPVRCLYPWHQNC